MARRSSRLPDSALKSSEAMTEEGLAVPLRRAGLALGGEPPRVLLNTTSADEYAPV